MGNKKIANLLGTVGLVGGMFYAMKQNKKFVGVATYGILFGVGGYLLGNALNKFYED